MKNIIVFLQCMVISFVIADCVIAQSDKANEIKYNIQVSLDDNRHFLYGYEEIIFKNNTGNVLNELVVLLYPNAYKNNKTALMKQLKDFNEPSALFLLESDLGYIDSLDFYGDNIKLSMKFDSLNEDICSLKLNSPLSPGEKITITTPFRVKIPGSGISQLGHIGQSYNITQWHPQIAVYDENGWNAYPYLDQGGFYYNYADFDVYITLPANYVVAASGALKDNPEEQKRIEDIIASTNAIIKYDNFNIDFPASDSVYKTLHFQQNNISEFVWFADKRYNIQNEKIKIDDSGKEIDVYAYYINSEGDIMKNACDYLRNAFVQSIDIFGEYPYSEFLIVQSVSPTFFQQFPKVMLIGGCGSSQTLKDIINYELNNEWFRNVVSPDGFRDPLLTESLSDYYFYRYLTIEYPDNKYNDIIVWNDFFVKLFQLQNYTLLADDEFKWSYLNRHNLDMAPNLSIDNYSRMHFAADVSSKPILSYIAVSDRIGEDAFNSIIYEYLNVYKFKHPEFSDLRNLFAEKTGDSLSWAFDGYLGSTGFTDYSVMKCKKVKKTDDNGDYCEITLKNKGEVAAPFRIDMFDENKQTGSYSAEGFTGKKNFTVPVTGATRIVVDDNHITVDPWRKNNNIRLKGLFKKCEPIRLQFIGSFDNPDRTQIFYTPVAGWNGSSGVMAGMAFYNHFLTPKPVEFLIMPMYAPEINSFAGTAGINYNIFPDKGKIHSVKLYSSVCSYPYSDDPDLCSYVKTTAGLRINFKPAKQLSHTKHSLNYRYVNICKDEAEYYLTAVDVYEYSIVNSRYYLNELTYTIINNYKAAPFSVNAVLKQGKDLVKIALEGKARIPYNDQKGLDVRMFYGNILTGDPDKSLDNRFFLSGYSGMRDIYFDHIFLDRMSYSEILSQQYAFGDGGFRFYTPLGSTWDWMWAVNFESAIPGKVPFKIYFDAATFAGAGNTPGISEKILYEGGIELCIIKDIFKISFPLLVSSDIENAANLYDNDYTEKIRFTLHLEKINPWQQITNLIWGN